MKITFATQDVINNYDATLMSKSSRFSSGINVSIPKESIEEGTYFGDLDAVNSQGSDEGDLFLGNASNASKETFDMLEPSYRNDQSYQSIAQISPEGIPPVRRPCAHSPAKYSKPGLPFRRPNAYIKMKLPQLDVSLKGAANTHVPPESPKNTFGILLRSGIKKYKDVKNSLSSLSPAILGESEPCAPKTAIDFSTILMDDSSEDSVTTTDESSMDDSDSDISDDTMEPFPSLKFESLFQISKFPVLVVSFLLPNEAALFKDVIHSNQIIRKQSRNALKSWLVDGKKCTIISTKSMSNNMNHYSFVQNQLVVKDVLNSLIDCICKSNFRASSCYEFPTTKIKPKTPYHPVPKLIFESCVSQQEIWHAMKSKQDLEGRKRYFSRIFLSSISAYKSWEQISLSQDGTKLNDWKHGVFKRKKVHLDKKYLTPEEQTKSMDRAALCGHNFILQKLKQDGFHCSTDAIDYAAEQGHLNTVEWIHFNLDVGCTTEAMDRAAQGGHLSVLEFLHSRGEGCTENALDFAAQNGHLDVVEWLHQNRDEGCSFQALDLAAMNGHLEVVEWFAPYWSEGFQVDSAMDLAAYGGHLHVLEWIYNASGITCTHRGEQWAASRKHMDVVRWLRTMVISDHEEVQILEEYFSVDEYLYDSGQI